MNFFYLFAGPNGSGKSTIIGNFLRENPVKYLNADYCARVDPDIEKMPDSPEKSIKAQRETERQLIETISEELDFAWETVFSHPSRLDIMEYAKDKGYRIHLTYIATKHPDINVARVHQRFLDGGHDVPEDKIRRRYARSVSFLPQMILLADEVTIYDNSYENVEPKRLFQKLLNIHSDPGPEMVVWEVDDDEVAEWVQQYIIKPLDEMGISVE